MVSPAPARLRGKPGLWQFWSLSTRLGYIWVTPVDAAARRALPEKGGQAPLLEVTATALLTGPDEPAQPTLF